MFADEIGTWLIMPPAGVICFLPFSGFHECCKDVHVGENRVAVFVERPYRLFSSSGPFLSGAKNDALKSTAHGKG